MTSRTDTLRRLLASHLAASLVALSVLVPLLDSGDRSGPVVESEHHASSCVVGHDHTICTQFNANRALTAGTGGGPAPELGALLPDLRPTFARPDRPATTVRRSRAPPLARA